MFYFGKNVYANFNLTLVDDGEIFVGDSVMFGPNVTAVSMIKSFISVTEKWI